MKTKNKEKRRTVTIDVTEVYDRLSERAKKDIRTLEEECRFFILKGLDGPDVTTVTYIQNPQTWDRAWGDFNVTPSYPPHTRTYPWNPCSDRPYCNDTSVGHTDTAWASTDDSVDTRFNGKSGCYEAESN